MRELYLKWKSYQVIKFAWCFVFLDWVNIEDGPVYSHDANWMQMNVVFVIFMYKG